eukprot:11889039-Prorocentrum_lima.AAC.1
MALYISTWGEQGRPWWIDVVSQARIKHQEWLELTPRERSRLEGRYILGEKLPIPPPASNLENPC